MAADRGKRGNQRGLWQWVGNLEANVARLLDGQADLKADLKTTNARIDRLMYGLILLGGGVVTLLVLEVLGRAG